jgi:hypothetical protein
VLNGPVAIWVAILTDDHPDVVDVMVLSRRLSHGVTRHHLALEWTVMPQRQFERLLSPTIAMD